MGDELAIRKSGTNAMTSAVLGRTISNLLTSTPKKIETAISRLGEVPATTSPLSLEDSLRFLSKYVRDAGERGEVLDELLIPIIENSLRSKESNNSVCQALVVLNWLFQDEILFKAVADDLVTVIHRKDDQYVALGWCTLIRSLLEYDSVMKQHLKNGLRERHIALLKILCSSISRLTLITCNGSVSQDGFELPTRLAVAAADCILVSTEQLANKPSFSSTLDRSSSRVDQEPRKRILDAVWMCDEGNNSSAPTKNIELGLLLWNTLDNLIALVEKLHCWSRKSRPLHAEGCAGVLKWLNSIKFHDGFHQDEADYMALKPGVLLLSSCWKHYSKLLRLEDHQFSCRSNELIDQYLSGIEFYSEDGPKENEESINETRKFFVNCLALLLGCLECKRLSSIMSDYGTRMSSVLLAQLHCGDKDVITGVVCIFNMTLLKKAGNNLKHLEEMEAILPSLLNLLDNYDSASRAAVLVLSHYCSITTNNQSFREVFKPSASKNVAWRRNIVDLISELIHISESSAIMASDTKEYIATHLLECLNDEESVIQNQAIQMLPLIDPLLVIPALIRLICSSNATVNSAPSKAFVGILRHHNESFEVISFLIDSMSTLCQAHDRWKAPEEAVREVLTMDIDYIFKLIPQWSETVKNWDPLVGPLLEKMFSDPSNSTIVRFLSCVSEYLADAADLVLDHILIQAKRQEESKICNNGKLEDLNMLFNHLCPFLIIKLLPLRVFDDLTSSLMYGQFLCQASGTNNIDISDHQCLAAYMLSTSFSQFEFQDVKKLSAELCGRIHPRVLYPVIFSQLELAVELRDTLRIKACLFTICTSLAVRGRHAISHPTLIRIRNMLQTLLMWPSEHGNEVSKAQHGCIDCLALMICAELQDSDTSVDPALEKSLGGNTTSPGSCLANVINLLTDENSAANILPGASESFPQTILFPLSYRVCMANILISTCQKIPDQCKELFARKTLPSLMQSFKNLVNQEIKAACTQVLFSAVYHLKLAVLPYADRLLDISLLSLKATSERERLAGVKLLGCLLGSEDPIVECISGRIFEVRSILLDVSKSDVSTDVRQICHKLLACFNS